MANISIEYCYECMFLGRATEIANSLLGKFPEQIESLSLIPGHDGIFSIELNERSIYEIGENGLPPQPDEVVSIVIANLK